MPDKRKHRGQHPQDSELFSESQLPSLRNAVADLSWLLSKSYNINSSLKLVGDRYQLNVRQRMAVGRSSCSDSSLKYRKSCEVFMADNSETLLIDGYNLLIQVESAFSGSYIFKGRDGCLRDIAGIHGSYRRVEETFPAIEKIGEKISSLGYSKVKWFLDAPISNSGRLKTYLYETASHYGWDWQVLLVNNPDKDLLTEAGVVVSSDSMILDKAMKWLNLGKKIWEGHVSEWNVIDLVENGG